MKSFRFPLEKALEWRRAQLEEAEAKFRQKAASLAEADRARSDFEIAAVAADRDVRQQRSLAGADLAALDEFRIHARAQFAILAARRDACARELATQQAAMLESRRRCRLLERLRERRWSEWQAAADREIEEVAADSYLARWGTRRSASYNEMHDP